MTFDRNPSADRTEPLVGEHSAAFVVQMPINRTPAAQTPVASAPTADSPSGLDRLALFDGSVPGVTSQLVPRADAATPNVLMLETAQFQRMDLPSALIDRIAVSDSWASASEFFAQGNGGCLLIDFDSNREAWIAQLVESGKSWSQISVIACSQNDSGASAMAAAKAGCIEFAVLPDRHEEVSRCCDLESAIGRACHYDMQSENSPQQFRSQWTTLTSREQEVVRYCLGNSNTKVIAKQLSVSYQTIDKHRNRALRKMNCGSLVEFASLLYGKSAAT
ncbi:LuxR C-terminal-related transcriptional regulator [Planctomycetes bacterium K23_9]|uniref:Response regulator protein TmoT n=1 Tax=Stieleria marina TaxID=1930275 RepID=A0A517NMQ9_9BACT|nr:Response regulator protein TmoT [Planctomycetes bacterium K23_9]